MVNENETAAARATKQNNCHRLLALDFLFALLETHYALRPVLGVRRVRASH